MNCPFCGTYNAPTNQFCEKCGGALNQQAPVNNVDQTNIINQTNNGNYNQQMGVGSLVIIRPNNFVGCLLDFDVYVDGYLVGSVPNNQTRQFPLYYGNHQVCIKHGFSTSNQMILINDSQRNLVFECKIKMGFVTNEIIFTLVNIYN